MRKNIPIHELSSLAKVITFACGLLLIVVLFLPLWQIELSAPQYPEGLVMKMYPNKLAGNVDIINGLNHYIGMKTLHTEDFIEFTLLPYIIVFFALFSMLVAVFFKNRKWLIVLFVMFILFGIIAMFDFWRWEYNYGHNLNPEAAIIVPGMSYQPPLIGYKKLLNFGAYSMPDTGGWVFIGVGLLLLTAVIIEFKRKSNRRKLNSAITAKIIFLMVCLTSCSVGPEKIQIGKDTCSFCKMSIADNRFGGEILTKKGKIYKFDDTHCILGFINENIIDNDNIKETYLVNFEEPHDLIEVNRAILLKSETLHSPMGGNIAGFSNQNKVKEAFIKFDGEEVTWNALLKK